MSAQAVLNKIEQQGLLDRASINELRRQVAQSSGPTTAQALVKLLVDQGQLTQFQGNKLLAETAGADELGLAPSDDETLRLADDPDEQPKPARPPAATAPSRPAAPPQPSASGAPRKTTEPDSARWRTAPKPKQDNRLPPQSGLVPLDAPSGLVPLDDAPPTSGLVPLDGASGLTPLDGASGLTPLDASSGLTPIDAGATLTPIGPATPGLTPLPVHDPLMEAAALEGAPFGGQPGQRQTKYVPKARRNPWESTLMYSGAGALVLMLLVGLILFVSLTRGSANAMFQLAEEAYKSEQYQDAMAKYEQFVASFPEDENASLAKVRSGLARIRSVVKGARDWRTPLATAQQVLPKIETEPKFAAARDELAAILPQIAEGFSTQAQTAQSIDKKEQYVELAEDAMELVENPTYIPNSLRKSPGTESRIEKVLAAIATVRRDINRERDLAAAIGAIESHAKKGDTQAAYRARDELLKAYPGLTGNSVLHEAVEAVSQKQRELVKVSSTPVAALTDDTTTAPEFQVVLAGRSGAGAAGASGQLAVIPAQGAVYALDAGNGRVMWRRYIGYDPAPPPQRIGALPAASVLAVDGGSHELLCLEGSTGKLRWRLPVGESFADPLIAEDGILLTAASGKVLLVNPETGAAIHAALPQSASVAAALEKGQPLLYQAADHTNLYVLSAKSLACQAVLHLGHKPGTVLAPPAVVRGHMLIAENVSPQASRLHVVATGENGATLERLTTGFDLKGRVVAPLLVQGSRVLVLTDLGAIHAFEVDPANKKSPVTQSAALAAAATQPQSAHSIAHQGQLFVGDRRLTKFEIQTSRGELIRRWPKYEGDEFIAPLQVFDDVVVHARRRQGARGVTVAASDTSDGRELWRAEIGAPLAGEAFADPQRRRFVALSATGQLFEIEQASISAGYLDQPTADVGATASKAPTFSTRFELPGDRLAFASQPPDTRLAWYDPAAREPLRLITPQMPTDTLACPPVLFQSGLLMPSTDGRVYLIDPATGASLAKPLQPALAPGAVVRWQRPAVLPGGARFAIADNRRRLYSVELANAPEPHLTLIKQVDVDVDIVSPLAAIGGSVLAVARGRENDNLALFGEADLSAGESLPLAGRVVWGPAVVGDRAFVATDGGALSCLADGAIVWEQKALLNGARLAGAPLAEGDEFVLALDNGVVRRIDAATGRETASLDLGQPLGAAPVPFAGQLLLTGNDGTLHVVSLTKPSS